MCHQSFQYFQCPHRNIVEQRCARATDHPFFLLVACENYTITSTHNRQSCGLGRYYCIDSPDASFLDILHGLRNDLGVKIAMTDQSVQAAQDNIDKGTARAEALNIPKHKFIAHPDYKTLVRRRDNFAERRNGIQKMHSDVAHVIQQTQYHVPRLQPGERLGYGYNFPRLSLPEWLASRLEVIVQNSPMKSIEQRESSYPDVEVLLSRPVMSLTPRHTGPTATPRSSNHRPKRSKATLVGKDVGIGMAGGPFATPSLRRSARTTLQPVTYAEDEDDDAVPTPVSVQSRGIKRGLALEELEEPFVSPKKLRLRSQAERNQKAVVKPRSFGDMGEDDFEDEGDSDSEKEKVQDDDWEEGMD